MQVEEGKLYSQSTNSRLESHPFYLGA